MDTAKERAVNWQPLVMRLPTFVLDAETFFDIAQANQDLRMELSAEGDLIVMPPAGTSTGDKNSEINMQLRQWAKRDGKGKAFDSSTGFLFPNQAVRSPDASWVSYEQLETLSHEAWTRFAPLCPEFVLELRSPSDRLSVTKEKMQEYMENGAELGWLIDPQEQRVHIYTADGVEVLEHPQAVVGTGVLAGFRLELGEIWQ